LAVHQIQGKPQNNKRLFAFCFGVCSVAGALGLYFAARLTYPQILGVNL
jgi:hypothetical protein